MKNALIGIIVLILAGCGNGKNGNTGYNGPTGSVGAPGPQGRPGADAAPAPAPSEVQTMVSAYNATRNAQGQDSVTQGMSCTLYTVPVTVTAIIGATLTNVGSFGYEGTFDQPAAAVTAGFNVLPLALQPVYQTYFIVKCTATLFNADNNWHEFSLTSDDGSNLYIGGILINNDGLHSAATVNAVKFLAQTTYSFELDFLQATGNQELILNEDGSLFDTSVLYH
jgi:hypothetical protein